MRFEDTILNANERAAAEKWMTKHKTACPEATFDTASAVSGYGYRMKVVCTKCGEREDVTDAAEHDPYPHR
jgi:hypothetical protein